MGSAPVKISETPSSKIAIIGGGLGGLCLAICLIHHDVPFHIYEAASSFGEIGAGIMCGPHSVNALRLISPDLLAAFMKVVTTNSDNSDPRVWGTYRFGMDSRIPGRFQKGEVESETRPEDDVWKRLQECGTKAMSSLHRARFLDGMVKLIPPGSASFNKSLERLVHTEAGVNLYFSDGTEAHADVAIGCDGIKSKVRASIMKEIGTVVEPKYAQEYAYRSLIEMGKAKEILGDQLATNTNVWQGYGAYMVTYPVEQGRMLNCVGVIDDNDFETEHSYSQLINSVPREKMYEDWKEWDPRLQRLLREFQTSNQWSLWDLIHDQPYYHKRVCLMGDAAHATVPHLGSGAGMAYEDAFVLGNLLAKVDDLGSSYEAIFKAFDAVRRPRTQKLCQASREAGKKLEFVVPGVMDDFEKLKQYSDMQYKWVWGYDLEQGLDEALAIARRS